MNILDRFNFITALRFNPSRAKLYIEVKKDSDVSNLKIFLDHTFFHTYEIFEELSTIPYNTQLVTYLRNADYTGFCNYLYCLDEATQAETLALEIAYLLKEAQQTGSDTILTSLTSSIDLKKLTPSALVVYTTELTDA